MDLKGHRVTVMGMARSGQAAALLARDLGAAVLCTDQRAGVTHPPGTEGVMGEHREADFTEADLVVVSPGVPAAAPPIQAALAHGVPVLGELAFAWELLQDDPVPWVAVTGTNGKSSVVSFTGQLLAQAGRRPFVGGNLGEPLSLLAHERLVEHDHTVDVAVVEVSSYQLELPGTFAPHVGAILNLTPDHLGRHGTMEVYAEHKLRLFDRCAPGDWALLPPDEALLPAEAVRPTGATLLWLGGRPGVVLQPEHLLLEGTPDDGPVPFGALQVIGAHNRLNLAAAVTLATCAGAPRRALDLSAVRPLKHRLERVHDADAVRWINDSKATNVQAAEAGIRAVEGPSVVLLGGDGKDGADYRPLQEPLRASARAILCFGRSGPEIAQALPGLPVEQTAGLAQAVARARELARPGDTVLLSPACASFDEFRDYEHRGEVFTALCRGATPAEVASRSHR